MVNNESIAQFKKIQELRAKYTGISNRDIAKELGLTPRQVKRRVEVYGSRFTHEIQSAGIPVENVPYGWIKDDGRSLFVTNPLYEKDDTLKTILDDTLSEMKKHAPKYPVLKRVKLNDPHLLIINLTDLHIGGETEKALERAKQAVDEALTRSQGYNIEKILFIGGNDMLHVDNPLNTTTKGTQLNPDTSFDGIVRNSRDFLVSTIEKLITIADVHYIHVQDNHAESLGLATSLIVEAWFHNSQNITFDVSNRIMRFYQYGETMLAFAHGHKMKQENVPLAMAQLGAKMWGETKYRYCYLGHIHHNKAFKYRDTKDYTGLTLEYLPSSTDTNDYEEGLGYITTPSVHSMIHNKERGMVAKIVTNF